MTKLAVSTLGSLLVLSGCTGILNQHHFTPVAPQAFPEQTRASPVAGSIYQANRDMRLFESRTARRVGDVLTIRLVESTNASKKADTNFGKNDGVTLANPILFGHPFDIKGATLETNVKGSRNFDGKGTSDQSNRLQGQISAFVVEVYPNGNLAIRGEKMLTLNQGEEFVQISGVVRQEDIDADNSVLSTKVADAQITYAGKGALADANSAGWLVRFFTSPLWPF